MSYLVKWCYRSQKTLRLLGCRGFQPRTFCPVLSNVAWYSDPCTNTSPCKPSNPCDSTRKPIRRKPTPCSTSGSGGGSSEGPKATYKTYVQPPVMDHDYKNMALKRPMSPHLTIFAMTMPAAMSIYQRVTGVIVTTYALGLSGGTLFLNHGIHTYISMIQSLNLSSTTVILVKCILALPFAYHYCNGIRFCLWNAGRFLSLKQVYLTGWICLMMTIAMAGIFAVIKKNKTSVKKHDKKD